MNKFVKGSQLFLKKNSATILTCIGAAGVVGTAVMTAKATIKASKVIDELENVKGEELTVKEKIQVSAPIYIPSVLMGAATITCIFGANFLNKKKQASLVGAYTMLDQTYKNYRAKVDELYGEGSNREIGESMAQDVYNEQPVKVRPDKELFYDMYSKRYFEATMEDVLKAENELNKALSTDTGVGINLFYKLLNMDEKPDYESLGWSVMQMTEMYWHAWIEFEHTKMTMDDGLECTVIDLPLEPVIDYLEY